MRRCECPGATPGRVDVKAFEPMQARKIVPVSGTKVICQGLVLLLLPRQSSHPQMKPSARSTFSKRAQTQPKAVGNVIHEPRTERTVITQHPKMDRFCYPALRRSILYCL